MPVSQRKNAIIQCIAGKGNYKCFGCGKGGSAVNFIMEHEHLSYTDALRWLAKKYNIEIREKEEKPEDVKERNDRESQLIVSEFCSKVFQQSALGDQFRKIDRALLSAATRDERRYNQKIRHRLLS